MLQPMPERYGLFTFMAKTCRSPQSAPLPRLVQGYGLYQQAKGCRPSTRSTAKQALDQLLNHLPVECRDDAHKITSDHLTMWAAGLEDKGYTTATRDQRIAKVKAFFGWAYSRKAPRHRSRRSPQKTPLQLATRPVLQGRCEENLGGR